MLFEKNITLGKCKSKKIKIFTLYQSQCTIKAVTPVSNLVCVLLDVCQAICKQIQR